jgi:hypothetical protein
MSDKSRARREIEKRNRRRAEAKLPLVSVEEELRRCEEAAIQKERDDFVHRSPLRQRVSDKLLNRMRHFLFEVGIEKTCRIPDCLNAEVH